MNICKKYYKGGLFTKRINQITCDECFRHVRLIADLRQNEELQRKLETLIWEKRYYRPNLKVLHLTLLIKTQGFEPRWARIRQFADSLIFS